LISALTGEGTRELIYECYQKLQELKAREPSALSHAQTEGVKRRVYKFASEPEWEIKLDDENVFVLTGRVMERLSRLSLEERDAQEYLYERLEALGVMAELRRRGLREGSTIRLGEYELVYSEQ
ncbi:MAG: Obg family GTPase CgtA, partial [Candidatus Bipolaricaulota bacterium]|nr:Obg family GTPase CgtA [Candidatus Bipolaricaulota bacterium]